MPWVTCSPSPSCSRAHTQSVPSTTASHPPYFLPCLLCSRNFFSLPGVCPVLSSLCTNCPSCSEYSLPGWLLLETPQLLITPWELPGSSTRWCPQHMPSLAICLLSCVLSLVFLSYGLQERKESYLPSSLDPHGPKQGWAYRRCSEELAERGWSRPLVCSQLHLTPPPPPAAIMTKPAP